MEKKNYVKPNTVQVKIRQNSFICTSQTSIVTGNTELKYVGADTGDDVEIRSRSFDAWDDED